MKKRGFTLAEVLITLGIIGVVATVTMPALMTNFQKQTYVAGIKKAYNTVQNAVDMYMAVEGISDLSSADFIGDTDALKTFVNQYFRIVTDCGMNMHNTSGGVQCFAEKYYTLGGSTYGSNIGKGCEYVAISADGVSLCFDTSDITGTEVNGETLTSSGVAGDATVLQVEVDINGPNKGPNQGGRDWFVLSIDSSGNIYDTRWDDDDHDDYVSYYQKNVAPMGIGYLFNNGWNMDY